MPKKQGDRRPADRPTERGTGKHGPGGPESGRGSEVPEGQLIERQVPTPGSRGGEKDFFESERSDRESGRPVQLEEDDEDEGASKPHRAEQPGFRRD